MTLRHRITAAIAAALLLLTVSAQPASAGINGTSIYNFGNVGIGIVTSWGNGYQYVLGVQRWSYNNSKGFYTGSGYCTDVYYDYGQGWKYQWSVCGATYASVAWQWYERVGVYSYRY